MIRNAVHHSENVRNSLGLNYKSAALSNWTMPAFPHTKAAFSEFIPPVSRSRRRVASRDDSRQL
jgi:hypothetical protein